MHLASLLTLHLSSGAWRATKGNPMKAERSRWFLESIQKH